MGARRFLRRHYRMQRYKAMRYGKIVDFVVLKDSKKAIRRASSAGVDVHMAQVPPMKERYLDRPWFRKNRPEIRAVQINSVYPTMIILDDVDERGNGEVGKHE